MALTFIREPQEYSPSGNELTFVMTTDNGAEDNFKVQCRIKDKDGNIISKQLFPVRPNDQIIIDVADVVRSLVGSDQIKYFLEAASGWNWQTTAINQNYTVDFQEWYGSTPIVQGSTSTYGRYAFAGVLRYNEFIDYSEDTYLIDVGSERQALSNKPLTRVIKRNESEQLTYISAGNGGGNTLAKLQIKTYTAGVLVQTATIDNANNPTSSNDNKGQCILVGTSDLNNSTLATGTLPLIVDAIDSYTVEVLDYASARTSQLITFNIDDKCTKYNSTRLHFLNRLGGVDSFTFKMKRIKTDNISRDSFKRLGYLFDTTYSNNITERGDVVYHTKVEEGYLLHSDWISESQAEWLRDLISSPQVWWERGDNDIVAINLKTNTYKVQTKSQDKLFSISIAFDLATQNYR